MEQEAIMGSDVIGVSVRRPWGQPIHHTWAVLTMKIIQNFGWSCCTGTGTRLWSVTYSDANARLDVGVGVRNFLDASKRHHETRDAQ